MSLANPQALWLLLLVPLPLLLSRRAVARRYDVSNLFLWTTSVDPHASTLKPRAARRQWVVILQMAIIASTVLALSRPAMESQSEHVVFVFDLSASMSARDAAARGGTRFDAARDRAQAVLAKLPRRSRVRLIAAGATARDLGEYGASDSALTRTIAQLAPAGGIADISGAVLLADRQSHGERVVVFSDHTADVGGSGEVPIVWETIGTPVDNVAVSSVVVRRRPLSKSTGDVLVAVHNYGSKPTRADVEIVQDGRVIGRRSLDVARDGEQTILMEVSPLGRVVTARLVTSDALVADNQRFDVVPPLERIRVSASGTKNFYVEKALAANPAIALVPSSSDADVVVCGCDGIPAAGNVLLLRSGDRLVEDGVLTVVEPDHPIASNVFFGGAIASVSGGGASGDVVIRAGEVPAVVTSEHDGRRIVELRFDPRPDTAVNAAFPVLVANAVRWLDGRQNNPTQVQAGEPLRWTLDRPGAIAVTGPDGKARAAQVSGRTLTVVDTSLPGVYTVQTPSGDRQFAVNAAVGESDLRRTGGAASAQNAAPTGGGADVPLMRLLMAVAAVLIAIEWLASRRRTALRGCIAAALLVAAAGLALIPRTSPLDVVALIDRSRSIPAGRQQDATRRVAIAAATMRRGDRLGVVAVGADALVESELSSSARPLSSGTRRSAVADTDTDIAAGLRVAHAMLPDRGDRRVVLFSDGRQTIGDAEREAALLAADGVHVDVSRGDPATAIATPVIAHVVAPAHARSAEPFSIVVDVKGPPRASAQMTLYRDERPVGTRDVRISASGTATQAFTDKQTPGIHVYRAALRSADGDDNGTGAVVSVFGESSVLYVARSAGVLETVLAAAGFRVTHAAPDTMPRGLDALLPYDSVVLDDVSADELGTDRASDIARYVDQFGGGLVLLGGARTLDLAGYPIGPLAASLPVDFRQRSGQRSPLFGLVVVFDKSGSMADQAGGASKIELARQAVMRVLDVLPAGDSLGVIAFDANPVAVAPLRPAQRAADVARQLQAIVPGGSTRIAPAVSLAAQWLNEPAVRAIASKRRILLISDGQTSPDDEQRLRATIAGAGVEVSAVAIGNNTNRSLLQTLASSTGGRAYFPGDLAELPKIVAREAARSRSGAVVEEPFVPRSASHPVMSGIDPRSLPTLSGYVVGAAKASAVNVLASHLDDPILSAWQFGLGRVAVFTADLRSSWSAPLRAWSGFGRLWAQQVRWVSRGLDDRQLRVTSARDGEGLRFDIDAEREDGRPIELIGLRAALRSPDDKSATVTFVPTGPGRYVAHVVGSLAGPYTLSLSARDGDGGAEHHVVTGLFHGDDQERASVGADDALLGRLAAITGGRVLSPSDNPFAGSRTKSYQDVSAVVAAAALAVYLIDLLFGARLISFAASTSRFPGRFHRLARY